MCIRDRQRTRERRADQADPASRSSADVEREVRQLERKRDDLTMSVEGIERRLREIDAMFCEDGFFDRSSTDEISRLETERADVEKKLEDLMEQWSAAEARLDQLSSAD